MNLEDHLGDIIRKARAMSNVSSADAAKAAGLSEAELAAIEETGKVTGQPNYVALAKVLGLDAAKLENIAKGWTPKAADLSTWRELHQITTTKKYAVHCYLLWDEVTRDAALFDTGWDAAPILKLVEENKLQLKHFFITHMHEDHIAAMDVIREKFPTIKIHTNSKTVPPQHKNRANDCVHVGSLRISNRETPGHAEDGVSYIIGNFPEDVPHVVISGDAIFAGSIGTGKDSWTIAKQKVKEQILLLPEDTLICPGHGPLTTVAEEKLHNPFF